MSRRLALEPLALTVLLAAATGALPLAIGHWGWSWDALNHHVYLGLISQTPRWHLDVVPASVQTWQYPYLYWPVYWLSQQTMPGAVAGALWAALLCGLLVPPLWLLAHRLMPTAGEGPQGAFDRSAAVLAGFGSVILLSGLGTTTNDPLATVPLLWALALMAVERPGTRRAAAAAGLWGVATAFKLSNGLALPLLLVWWWQGPGWPLKLRRGLAIAAGALAGFAIAYGPWGWQLWQQTGNPFHPFFGSIFGR